MTRGTLAATGTPTSSVIDGLIGEDRSTNTVMTEDPDRKPTSGSDASEALLP
jgi:hypothetical protein